MLKSNFSDQVGASRLITQEMEIQYIDLAMSLYQKALSSSIAAKSYLTSERGLALDLIEDKKIGYVDRSLGKVIPDGDHFEGAMIRGALQRFGLLKSNGRELFRGCVVFPVFDEFGKLVDVYGRKVAKYQRKGVPHHLRLQQYGGCLYNSCSLKSFDSIILCSSPLEALTLISRDIHNVVSLMGLGTFNRYYLEALNKSQISRIVIIFANTCFGNRYKKELSTLLTESGICVEEVQLPRGEDINTLHQKSCYSGFVDSVFENIDSYKWT